MNVNGSGDLAAPADLHLVCDGCGLVPPRSLAEPFRCPAARAGDDIDHVLRRVIAPTAAGFPRERDGEANPAVRYRERFYAYAVARDGGLSDDDYVELVRGIDRAIAAVDESGRGPRVTPFTEHAALGARLGLSHVWVKDETGHVAGSHKARHLLGILIYLEVLDRLGRGRPRSTPLCIASCGNAALAAAVLARAVERPLHVFIPPWAHPAVVERLGRLQAHLVVCPRVDDTPGDPCYHRFLAAVREGGIPFCCQGPDNGLAVEGGETLGYEMVSALAARGVVLDRLFVQVGGGALASACVQAFEEAVAAGVLPRLPRIHPVQTRGAAPLSRAHLLVERLWTKQSRTPLTEVLREAAGRRSAFMWPWEQEPKSIADGIIDDETYDWLRIVEGTLRSGGAPLVVDEEELAAARDLGRETTSIRASATGTAGLAGLLQLARAGGVGAEEQVAVLFTGVQR